MKSSARFDRAAFEGMALDWTAFGRVSPDQAARERVALDRAARDAAIRATAPRDRVAPHPVAASRRTDGVVDMPVVARRTAVRGGVVCGRRAPVHRGLAVHSAVVRESDSRESDVRIGQRRAERATVSAGRAARGRRRLRLTTRGRFVLIVLPLAAALSGVFVGVAGQQQATASTVQAPHPATVIVPAGGSLWSVAERVAPNADPRDVVAEFVRVNALSAADVQAGERLTVPTEYVR